MTTHLLPTTDATNVLVAEEPLSGTYVRTLTAAVEADAPAATNVLSISLTQNVPKQLHQFEEAFAGQSPATLALVAVDDGDGDGGVTDSALETTTVSSRLVSAPKNFTELGMALSHYLKAWQDGDERVVVGFDSITALRRYGTLDETYRFLNVMTNRLEATGATGYYNFATDAHTERERRVLLPLFDAMIEADESNSLSVTTEFTEV